MLSTNERDDSIGSIRISEEVAAAVARSATMEVDGVESVATANVGLRGLFAKSGYSKPVKIAISEDIARISVCIVVNPVKRIPDLAHAVQLGVKNAVQNMTGLAVSNVDVVIAGVAAGYEGSV